MHKQLILISFWIGCVISQLSMNSTLLTANPSTSDPWNPLAAAAGGGSPPFFVSSGGNIYELKDATTFGYAYAQTGNPSFPFSHGGFNWILSATGGIWQFYLQNSTKWTPYSQITPNITAQFLLSSTTDYIYVFGNETMVTVSFQPSGWTQVNWQYFSNNCFFPFIGGSKMMSLCRTQAKTGIMGYGTDWSESPGTTTLPLEAPLCYWWVAASLPIWYFYYGNGEIWSYDGSNVQQQLFPSNPNPPSDHTFAVCMQSDTYNINYLIGDKNGRSNFYLEFWNFTSDSPVMTSTSTSSSTSSSVTSTSSSLSSSSSMGTSSSSTMTSSSDATPDGGCQNNFPTADCTNPDFPAISGNLTVNETLHIPGSIETLTIHGDMFVSPMSTISIDLATGHWALIIIDGTLHAAGSLSLDVAISGVYTLFHYAAIVGDFNISAMSQKRSSMGPCMATPIRQPTSYRVQVECGNLGMDLAKTNSSPEKSDLVVFIAVPIAVFILLVIGAGAAIILVRRKKQERAQKNVEEEIEDVSMANTTLDHVQVEKKIGSGSFGEVYSGTWNGSSVALKKMKEDDHQEFLAEIGVLSTVNHPNIVQYYGVAVIEDIMYIVMEWMPLGSLKSIIKEIDPSELIDIAAQCAAGMLHLSQKKILHRDVALRNVLMAKTKEGGYLAKMSDFGMARMTAGEDYTSEGNVFPVKWCAPEIINHRQFSIESDVWAFGVMLWEIFSYGAVPYPGRKNMDVVEFVVSGGRMTPPSGCPPHVSRLMLQMWEEDPHQRPNFATIHQVLQLRNLEESA